MGRTTTRSGRACQRLPHLLFILVDECVALAGFLVNVVREKYGYDYLATAAHFDADFYRNKRECVHNG